MAHKKAGGSTRNGRDSNPKYLGVKRYGSEWVTAGSIIVRQKGTKYHAGAFVGQGSDYTLFAKVSGYVNFKVTGRLNRRTVNIIPAESAQAAAQA